MKRNGRTETVVAAQISNHDIAFWFKGGRTPYTSADYRVSRSRLSPSAEEKLIRDLTNYGAYGCSVVFDSNGFLVEVRTHASSPLPLIEEMKDSLNRRRKTRPTEDMEWVCGFVNKLFSVKKPPQLPDVLVIEKVNRSGKWLEVWVAYEDADPARSFDVAFKFADFMEKVAHAGLSDLVLNQGICGLRVNINETTSLQAVYPPADYNEATEDD